MSRERTLHPAAWWLWALGLGTAASRTTNPIVLGAIIAAAGFVVARRRGNEPWSGAFVTAVKLGAFFLVVRMLLQLVYGPDIPGFVVIHLPEVPLPGWAVGVRLGGDTTLPSLAIAARQGLQFATIIIVTGAANSLASPFRLMRSLPGVLYEAGVALTVAMSFGPQMVVVARRIRTARRLRGRPTKGLRGLRGLALPVLEGGLAQAIVLAAAMDSRGYGRRGPRSSTRTRIAGLMLVAGLSIAALGAYFMLDRARSHGEGAATLLLAAVLIVSAVMLGGATGHRTRYRPDPFGSVEWLVTLCGVGAALALFLDTTGLEPPVLPLQWPTLPTAALLMIGLAVLPAWLAPPQGTPAPRAAVAA